MTQENTQVVPVTRKQKIVKNIVYTYGGIQVFFAMIGQGAAAYVQFYEIASKKLSPGFVVPASAAVGFSSFFGKWALIYYFNLFPLGKIANFMSDDLLRKDLLSYNWKAVKDADWSKRGVLIKAGKALNLAFAAIPATVFGYLTFITFDSFKALVNETHPGEFFEFLSKHADNKIVRDTCFNASFISNLIASPGMVFVAMGHISQLINQFRSVKTPFDKTKVAVGTTLGAISTGITTWGFYNFLGLAESIGEKYLDMSPQAASAYSMAMYVYMIQLGFIAGFPLFKGIGESIVELLDKRYRWEPDPSIKKHYENRERLPLLIDAEVNREAAKRNYFPPASTLARNTVAAILLALPIVVLGGLPNVFQADQLEKEAKLDLYTAEAASAITEFSGTYFLISMALFYLGLLIVKLANLTKDSIKNCISQTHFGRPSGAGYMTINNREESALSMRFESPSKNFASSSDLY